MAGLAAAMSDCVWHQLRGPVTAQSRTSVTLRNRRSHHRWTIPDANHRLAACSATNLDAANDKRATVRATCQTGTACHSSSVNDRNDPQSRYTCEPEAAIAHGRLGAEPHVQQNMNDTVQGVRYWTHTRLAPLPQVAARSLAGAAWSLQPGTADRRRQSTSVGRRLSPAPL